jgi:CCR4-NOT transcription complex subunit 2
VLSTPLKSPPLRRYNRNWRYHKNYRLWLTKETGTAASRKDAAHEEGLYTFFDPENWEKLKKDAVIQYDQLEERPALSGVGASIGVPNVGAPVVGIPQGVGATGVPRYGMQGL